MNTIVTIWSNACKYGIVGYNEKGMACRWYILPKLDGVLTLNLLELLAAELSIYMTIHKLGHGSYIQSLTDSSSFLWCIHKASLDPVNEGGHETVAQWLRWTLISNKVSLYY